MAMMGCSSLASRATVHIPWPARNLCSMSRNVIATMKCRFRSMVNVFQSTSTRPIPHNYPLYPLGINKTVYQMLSLASVPLWNAAWTMVTNLCQLVPPCALSQVVSCNHWCRCSTYIPNGPPDWFSKSLRTSQTISLSSATEYLTGNVCTPTGIVWPGDGA